jgi:hypothetical protein
MQLRLRSKLRPTQSLGNAHYALATLNLPILQAINAVDQGEITIRFNANQAR